MSAFPAQDLSAGLVADLAVALALCGRTVLVVDWSVDATSVDACLSRIPGVRLDSRQLGRGVREALRRGFGPEPFRLDDPRPWPVGRWRRHGMHALPGTVTVADLGWDATGRAALPEARIEDQVNRFCGQLRSAAARYDHVLLYGGGPRSDRWRAMVVTVADAVVFGPPSAGGSADLLAGTIGDLRASRPESLDVVVVASGDDVRDARIADRVLDDPGSVRMVAGPARHTDPSVLGVLLPGSRDDVTAEIGRIVTGLAELPAAGDELVEAYARALGTASAGGTPTYHVAYAPIDRGQADRLAGWLLAAGVSVRRFDPAAGADGHRVLAVLSPALVADRDVWDALPADARPVRMETDGEAPDPGDRQTVDLRVQPREDRAAVLLGELDLFVGREHEPSGEQRRPTLAGPVPRGGARFAGREQTLERIRDALAPWEAFPSGPRSVVLTGEAGVGKSRLAIEYVRRFADGYTGVLWVPGRSRNRGGWTSAAPVPIPADLIAGTGHWLVVLDDVEDEIPEAIDRIRDRADLLVTTTGDVRPGDDVRPGAEIVVGELDADSCAAVLRDEQIGTAGLTDDQVRAVRDLVGGAPIPLALAAAGVRREVRRLQDAHVASDVARENAVAAFADAFADADPSVPVTGRAVDVLVAQLERGPVGRLVVRLAEICAFLAPDGIGLSLIRSPAMVRRLADVPGTAGTQLLSDELELDRVLALGAAFGLFDVTWSGPETLRMHRVLQRAFRDLPAGDDKAARRADALRILAGAAPFDDRTPGAADVHAELRRHFRAAGVVEATCDPAVEQSLGRRTDPGSAAWTLRRLVVEQVTFTFQTGDDDEKRAALAFVDELERRWRDAFGPDDPLRCRLASLRGALLHDAGDDERALAADQTAIADFRRSLGIDHPRSALSTDGFAGDLKALGRFDEALPESETAWRQLREAFGDDHPRTLSVAFNLARARFLAGQHQEALELHRVAHRLRERVLGTGHEWYRQSVRAFGFLLRETGSYEEARAQLDRALRLYQESGVPLQTDLGFLRAKHAYEVTLRRGGLRASANDAELDALVADLTARLGEDHPETLAAVLNRSAELAAAGRTDRARRAADGCAERVAAAVRDPGHPLIGAVLTDVAVLRLADDDPGAAAGIAREAVGALAASVDEDHPWLVTARSNLAAALWAHGDRAVATGEIRLLRELCDNLDPRHPVAVVVAGNVAAAAEPGTRPWQTLDIDYPPL